MAPPFSGRGGGAPPPDRAPSFERMEWFQALLTALWPGIRGAFERDVLKGLIEPQLASKVPGLRFGGTSLGDRPPELRGVRTKAIGTEEVQIALDLGFHPGNSINISLVFGAISAGLCDLNVHGQICISLMRIVPRKPVVCGAKIYFANAPTISFNFSGLARALPIPPQKIKELVLEALASKLVLPHAIDVHVDSIARCFTEPDFLDYHELNSIPPVAVLKLRVASIEGPLVERLEPEAPSLLSMIQGRPPSVYALIRVGGQQERTDPTPRDRDTGGLVWTGKQHDFVIDRLADQDVYVELYNEDHGRLVQCDELLASAKISVRELAREFSGGRSPYIRLGMVGPQKRDAATGNTCAAVMTGTLQPLLARAPATWTNAEVMLLLSIDCVIGLAPTVDGRRFTVRAQLLPESFGQKAVTSVKTAAYDQVTEARVLHTALEEAPLAAARERLRLLYDRGARLSPEDAAFVLAGLIGKKEAALLLKEIEREGKSRAEADRGVEMLFGEQLRLRMGDPNCYGLRVELIDEDRKGATVGVLEWSSLSFLARSGSLEDDLQAYSLEGVGGSGSSALTRTTKLFLKRSLRVLG